MRRVVDEVRIQVDEYRVEGGEKVGSRVATQVGMMLRASERERAACWAHLAEWGQLGPCVPPVVPTGAACSVWKTPGGHLYATPKETCIEWRGFETHYNRWGVRVLRWVGGERRGGE